MHCHNIYFIVMHILYSKCNLQIFFHYTLKGYFSSVKNTSLQTDFDYYYLMYPKVCCDANYAISYKCFITDGLLFCSRYVLFCRKPQMWTLMI